MSEQAFKFLGLDEHGRAVIRVLRLKQVLERLGVGRSTLYCRLNPNSRQYDPTFPRPIRLSGGAQKGGAIGFLESDICRWIDSRVAAGWRETERSTKEGNGTPAESAINVVGSKGDE